MLDQAFFSISQSLASLTRWLFFEWRRFSIKKNEIVADFGSGDRPFIRADILVEKFLSSFKERPSSFVDNGAYIIQADLEQLPFKDKSIDFVYSSHVVEHLEKLRDSLEETSRVAKKGFIVCPSSLRENLMAIRSHLWLVDKKREKLLFVRKIKPYPGKIGNYFENLMNQGKGYIWSLMEDRLKKDMEVEYYWKGRIKYQIKGEKQKINWSKGKDRNFKPGLFSITRGIIISLVSGIVRFFYSPKINIEKILCCPQCKNDLKLESKYCYCQNCQKKFKHKNKRVFYFLDG